jgi:topoisomerase-4 subunit A
MNLADYAERAYLEYALSVVKGRALPDVCDGLQARAAAHPVQRWTAWAWASRPGNTGAKPVKSARVVGDVLGRFHPHGDQAAYDALVRMAQDFAQRYPLIDGQGNFGSRDGDGAAAMRYTEARLAPIARLLLDEIDEGTVDFQPNYDGSTKSRGSCRPAAVRAAQRRQRHRRGPGHRDPQPQPARGRRRGVALIRNQAGRRRAVRALLPAPDYPGGGQIISSAADIRAAYASGRGSLKVRARWKIEDLARGQWQLVVTELPPGTSAQRCWRRSRSSPTPRSRPARRR